MKRFFLLITFCFISLQTQTILRQKASDKILFSVIADFKKDFTKLINRASITTLKNAYEKLKDSKTYLQSLIDESRTTPSNQIFLSEKNRNIFNSYKQKLSKINNAMKLIIDKNPLVLPQDRLTPYAPELKRLK